MLKRKLRTKQLLAFMAISTTLYGCGSDSGASQPASEIQIGQLIDSAVEGVEYETESLSGVTNANGEFKYRTGENIRFRIGAIELNAGEPTAVQAMITPADLMGSSNPGETKAINLMQFLQSLDEDANPGNGIKITDTVRVNAKSTSLDFNSVTFVNDIEPVVAELTEGTGSIVDADDALTHFYETVTQLIDAGNTNLPDTQSLVVPEFTQVVYISPTSPDAVGSTYALLNLDLGSAYVTIQYGEGDEVTMTESVDTLTWTHEYDLATGSQINATLRLKSKNGVLLSSHTQHLTGQVVGTYEDSDSDGTPDSIDAFPFDANETLDSDGDGVGNNADTDDDNDGVLDINDAFPLNSNRTRVSEVIWPVNDDGLNAVLRDTHGDSFKITGTIEISAPKDAADIAVYELYWADADSETIQGQAIKILPVTDASAQFLEIRVDEALTMPDADSQLKLVAKNGQGVDLFSSMIRFLDFTGNVSVSGKGGNPVTNWQYGLDRDYLFAHRDTANDSDLCVFDNGLVMVVDMENQTDSRQAHSKDDNLYPAFSFDCSESLVNNEKVVYSYNSETDEDEVSTYSALNDAFFYGTVTHNMFFKYLGRPAFDDKFRLRVHYGDEFNFGSAIFWSGEYANFGDELYYSYGSTGLDFIAHELAHGFLDKNSQMVVTNSQSSDARTMHEAFSDITGVAAKYFYTGELNWLHGEEAHASLRYNNKIITENGAIPSYLDYGDDGLNPYLRIGMLSYPFYLLTNTWGMDRSYPLFLDAAQSCWAASMNLQQAAECVLQAGIARNEPQADIIDAFKAVKIQLFDEGSLAHFNLTAKKATLSFSAENSVSTSHITQWHWDFGDGNTSNEAQPVHDYAQGGLYNPVLTVTDAQGHTDSYTRPVDVFSDYCAPAYPSLSGRSINTITVNDTVIDTSGVDDKYDYIQPIISIANGDNIAITVAGDIDEPFPTAWKIWLDSNDDGVFDNSLTSTEVVHRSFAAKNSVYGLETGIAVPDGSVSGPLRMRISGRFSSTRSPCDIRFGSTVDVLIEVQ